MQALSRTLSLALVGICLAVPVWAQTATDMSIGTWKLNLAKSKYDPGPPPKSGTRSFEDRGGGVVVYKNEGIDASGNPTFASYTFKYDGKDYPTGYDPATRAQSTSSYRLIDPYTMEYTGKVNGKVIANTTRTVSKDGKTMTYRPSAGSKNVDAQGRPVNTVTVWDKQ